MRFGNMNQDFALRYVYDPLDGVPSPRAASFPLKRKATAVPHSHRSQSYRRLALYGGKVERARRRYRDRTQSVPPVAGTVFSSHESATPVRVAFIGNLSPTKV
jgi:hypothetical protein